MYCELSNHNSKHLVLLNITHDGRLITFGCLKCLKKVGYWCEEHKMAHREFPPDGTACMSCISILAAEKAQNGPKYLGRLEKELPQKIWHELVDFLDPDPDHPQQAWRAMRITQELATRAACRKTTVDEEVKRVIDAKSIDPIFPNPFKERALKGGRP